MMCSNNTNQQREITNEHKGSRVCDVANQNFNVELKYFDPRA